MTHLVIVIIEIFLIVRRIRNPRLHKLRDMRFREKPIRVHLFMTKKKSWRKRVHWSRFSRTKRPRWWPTKVLLIVNLQSPRSPLRITNFVHLQRRTETTYTGSLCDLYNMQSSLNIFFHHEAKNYRIMTVSDVECKN